MDIYVDDNYYADYAISATKKIKGADYVLENEPVYKLETCDFRGEDINIVSWNDEVTVYFYYDDEKNLIKDYTLTEELKEYFTSEFESVFNTIEEIQWVRFEVYDGEHFFNGAVNMASIEDDEPEMYWLDASGFKVGSIRDTKQCSDCEDVFFAVENDDMFFQWLNDLDEGASTDRGAYTLTKFSND